jgi:hypothetical protein
VFPAFAILIGRRLATIDRLALRRHLVFVAALAIVAAVTIAVVPLDSEDHAATVDAFREVAVASLLAWLAGTGIAIVLATRGRVGGAIIATGLGASIGWSALLLGHETLGRGMSTYDLARAMQPSIAADTPIYSVGIFEHTLDFYLQRPVTLVAFGDELEFGLEQEPAKGIPGLAAFVERWNADRAPLAIMAQDVFDTLVANRLPMRVVARDGRRIVIGKPTAVAPATPPSPTATVP